jgi:predicted  nucleic acid-binding Zn ribbon protein
MNSDTQAKLIVIVLLLFVMFLCSEIRGCDSSNQYNNGHCPCGGRWQYQQAISRGRYGEYTDYIYKCDKCGRIIEISNYYGGN